MKGDRVLLQVKIWNDVKILPEGIANEIYGWIIFIRLALIVVATHLESSLDDLLFLAHKFVSCRLKAPHLVWLEPLLHDDWIAAHL